MSLFNWLAASRLNLGFFSRTSRRIPHSPIGRQIEWLENRVLLSGSSVIEPPQAAAAETGSTGQGQSFDNRQDGLGLHYVVALIGIYPSRNIPLPDGEGGPAAAPSGSGEPFLGEIKLFAGNFPPRGYALADGQLLSVASNSALFSLYGTIYGGDGRTTFGLPDLRGRIAVGAGQGPGLSDYHLGAKGGSENVTLNQNQLPTHNHGITGGTTGDTGAGSAYDNRQPYLAINYIIKTTGTFDELGEIEMFGGNFAPRGYALAHGQTLPIASFTALFSKIGTTYGGDGQTTFKLPDLRGRAAVGEGNGLNLGQTFGKETESITTDELPLHTHTLPGGGNTNTAGGNQLNGNASPSLVVNYRIATTGTFPSRSIPLPEDSEGEVISQISGNDVFIAEMEIFASPDSQQNIGSSADGQLLSINSNQALFSLLGTTFGGDGRTTFGLPDLRGRAPIHVGTGPGLNPVRWGQRPGATEFNLAINQMPGHTHSLADTQAPTPVITGPTGPIDGDAFDVTIDFGESVNDFVIGDVTVGNGTATNFTDNTDGTFTVEITPTGTGNLTVDVAANVATDDASNQNLAATQFAVTVDADSPAPIITGPTGPIDGDAFDVTIDFGETVNDFVIGEVTVANGTATDFTDNTDGTFTVEITPTGSGDVTVDVAANVATDNSTNPNSVAIQYSVTVDADAPAPVITGPTSPIGGAAFDVTIDFGETVNDFVIGDVTLGNGTATDFTDNTDGTFTVEITPTGSGNVTVDVAAHVATDDVGNANTAATQFTVRIDADIPVPVISGPTGPIDGDAFDVTIDFGETVNDFVVGDVTVGNGTATDFTDNTDGTFTVEITPTGTGETTVDVAAGVATDAATNANMAAVQFAVTIDADAPTPTITGPVGLRNSDPFDVTIDFGESVNDFVIGDVTVGNGTATDFTDNTDGTFTVEITPTGSGDVTVDVAAGVATDDVGNPNLAATPFSVTVDATLPAPVITAPDLQSDTTPFDVTIDFGEEVTGFDLTEIAATGGAVANLIDNGGGSFTVTVTPDGSSRVTLAIPAGAVTDAVGNTSEAADPSLTLIGTLTVDNTDDESDGDFSAGDLSLREAIELANANTGADVIEFDDALVGETLLIDSGQMTISDDLTINSDGKDVTLDTAGSSRHFQIAGAAGQNVAIDGLTLKNGADADGYGGGAIHVDDTATLSLTDVTLETNRTTFDGGAIYLANGTTLIGSGLLTEGTNTAAGSGGVIMGETGSSIALVSSQLNNATATGGNGGAIASMGEVILSATQLLDNSAEFAGGAVYFDGTTLRIENNSQLTGNMAKTEGGALWSSAATDAIIQTGALFTVNTAGTDGGGIFNAGSMRMTSFARAYRNEAGRDGGGLFSAAGSSVLMARGPGGRGPRLVNNTATGRGGGVFMAGSLRVNWGFINNNTAARGGGLFLATGGTFTRLNSRSLTIRNNRIGNIVRE